MIGRSEFRMSRSTCFRFLWIPISLFPVGNRSRPSHNTWCLPYRYCACTWFNSVDNDLVWGRYWSRMRPTDRCQDCIDQEWDLQIDAKIALIKNETYRSMPSLHWSRMRPTDRCQVCIDQEWDLQIDDKFAFSRLHTGFFKCTLNLFWCGVTDLCTDPPLTPRLHLYESKPARIWA
jgi:hypothetical protein